MSGPTLYTYVWNNPTNDTDPTGFEVAPTPAPMTPPPPGWSPGGGQSCGGGSNFCYVIDFTGNFFGNLDWSTGDKQSNFTNNQGTTTQNAASAGGNTSPNGGGNPVADAANSGSAGSVFQKFVGEIDGGGFATQVGRKLLDDFVNNNLNNQSSPDVYQWLAGKLDGTYQKPDTTSANGVLANIGLTAATLYTPGGAEAKAATELPAALRGGEAIVHVYDGVKNGEPVYVGITNDLKARQAGHGDRFALSPLTSTPVTRGEARAIEQARIVENPNFQNIRNSISPTHSYYQQAVDWGTQWLRSHGF